MSKYLNKYLNKKITFAGETFDSKKELRRYHELLLQEKAGMITGLERQRKFVLIPTQREPYRVGKNGRKMLGKVIEKECSYVADFTYMVNDKLVVEDVKGYKGGGAYAVYIIKRKLMLERYGIKVIEI